MAEQFDGPVPKTVTARVFRVLSVFGAEEHSLGLADVSKRTGLAPSTALRLLRELTSLRVLEQVDDGGYAIGMHLFELGMRAPAQRRLRQVAFPILEDLYEVTHESVQLGAMDGTSVLVVQQVAGHRSVRTPGTSGDRLPAYSTANGKVILAFSEPELVARVVAEGLKRLTPYTVSSAEQLHEQLETIRSEGFALVHEENSLGTTAVGVPVLNMEGRAVAAMSVVFNSTKRHEAVRFAPALMASARTISRLWAQGSR